MFLLCPTREDVNLLLEPQSIFRFPVYVLSIIAECLAKSIIQLQTHSITLSSKTSINIVYGAFLCVCILLNCEVRAIDIFDMISSLAFKLGRFPSRLKQRNVALRFLLIISLLFNILLLNPSGIYLLCM